ncbi:dihydrodipicolinate synthase family protein [Mesorhizobium sp.]|uniref:dihydrodipicolinate synthase family protein n=1 Tax=Mesorhizobium sp. TaxID=1871066 RepID=UPI000FE97F99|nr:dihydrodipicolinate synthase family protein [Mesorhizobium sp.]RWG74532.1 MAG: hypothetical protein EOQ68_27870 [Mesorhizobium sp.]
MADFQRIRARAAKRKGGEEALASLLGPMPDNAAVAKVHDDRILSTMAERIFAAGFVWRVIEQKWPGFEEAFLGFEPKRLLFQPDDFWHELASDKRFVAIKESSDDIRRSTEIINRLGDRYDLFTGVDNLAFEALSVGAIGWVAGLVTAFPRETVAIYQLMRKGRREEALKIYRWFRPLLDLDVSTYLVQNIKLAEVLGIGTNDRVRMPRQPLSGERRKAVEKIVRDALAARPELPAF